MKKLFGFIMIMFFLLSVIFGDLVNTGNDNDVIVIGDSGGEVRDLSYDELLERYNQLLIDYNNLEEKINLVLNNLPDSGLFPNLKENLREVSANADYKRGEYYFEDYTLNYGQDAIVHWNFPNYDGNIGIHLYCPQDNNDNPITEYDSNSDSFSYGSYSFNLDDLFSDNQNKNVICRLTVDYGNGEHSDYRKELTLVRFPDVEEISVDINPDTKENNVNIDTNIYLNNKRIKELNKDIGDFYISMPGYYDDPVVVGWDLNINVDKIYFACSTGHIFNIEENSLFTSKDRKGEILVDFNSFFDVFYSSSFYSKLDQSINCKFKVVYTIGKTTHFPSFTLSSYLIKEYNLNSPENNIDDCVSPIPDEIIYPKHLKFDDVSNVFLTAESIELNSKTKGVKIHGSVGFLLKNPNVPILDMDSREFYSLIDTEDMYAIIPKKSTMYKYSLRNLHQAAYIRIYDSNFKLVREIKSSLTGNLNSVIKLESNKIYYFVIDAYGKSSTTYDFEINERDIDTSESIDDVESINDNSQEELISPISCSNLHWSETTISNGVGQDILINWDSTGTISSGKWDCSSIGSGFLTNSQLDSGNVLLEKFYLPGINELQHTETCTLILSNVDDSVSCGSASINVMPTSCIIPNDAFGSARYIRNGDSGYFSETQDFSYVIVSECNLKEWSNNWDIYDCSSISNKDDFNSLSGIITNCNKNINN